MLYRAFDHDRPIFVHVAVMPLDDHRSRAGGRNGYSRPGNCDDGRPVASA
jgi:hypothetical protein